MIIFLSRVSIFPLMLIFNEAFSLFWTTMVKLSFVPLKMGSPEMDKPMLHGFVSGEGRVILVGGISGGIVPISSLIVSILFF